MSMSTNNTNNTNNNELDTLILAFGMDDVPTTYHKSLIAGMVLGLAGLMYLSVLSLGAVYTIYSPFFKLIGAFIFSYGLITIVNNKYYLYTGSIAKANISSFVEWIYLAFCILGNILILFIIGNLGALIIPELVPFVDSLVLAKMEFSWWNILLKAIGCGMFMYFAVRSNNLAITAFSVIGFMLCGFEHCLADWFYFCMASHFSWDMVGFFLLALLGNTIGANIVRLIDGEIKITTLSNFVVWFMKKILEGLQFIINKISQKENIKNNKNIENNKNNQSTEKQDVEEEIDLDEV